MIIRPEKENDYAQIFNVQHQAFHKECEPQLVEALRKSNSFIPELSLVAVENTKVIGHIMFTKIMVQTTQRQDVPVLSLAPLGVLPEYQNQGVGKKLVRAGLSKCIGLGYSVVVVVGHPEYYPRFGFISARSKGLKVSFPVPDEAFMVVELMMGALDGVTGMVIYPPEFGI